MGCKKIFRLLGFCFVGLFGLTTLGFSGSAVASASSVAMTNSDVVKLVKLGFDESVVEAKIDQAPAVKFSVDIASLSKLKAEHVPQSVIAAMLKRSTATASAQASPHAFGQGSAHMIGPAQVFLPTKTGGQVALQAIGGTMHNRGYFIARISETFPDAAAGVRTTDHRPALQLDMMMSPRGSVKVVKLQSDPGKATRTLTLGRINGFTGSGDMNYAQPSPAVQVPCDLVQVGENVWHLTPKQDLAPGEYGVMVLGQLFDFGVDP